MIFKRFRLNVVLRVLIITLGLMLFAFIWERDAWPPTRLLLLVCVGGMVAELIYYVEKTNRDLSNFLLSIKHRDFTSSFSQEERGKSFSTLREAFNQIMEGYQSLRAEKEFHYRYLQNVIEHVSVALLCFKEDGEVELMNQAAQELLDRPYMSHIRVLNRVNPDLLTSVREIKPGERRLVKTLAGSNLLQLSLQCTIFKLQETQYKLVSLQDIRSELDEREVETWQKLIQVLTHEIMNSVTPIISLSKIIRGLMAEEGNQVRNLAEIDPEDAQDMLDSIMTIESRSKGLLHFVHAYRSLTKIHQPRFAPIEPIQMLKRIQTLLGPELLKRNISLNIHQIENEIVIQADQELIEQVLINLVKNAMEGLEAHPSGNIEIKVSRSQDQRPMIQVIDNGSGINSEYIDKIFIPFFTTKKRGSGIGLSLSRQIMRLHRGSISFHSNVGTGTVFSLVF